MKIEHRIKTTAIALMLVAGFLSLVSLVVSAPAHSAPFDEVEGDPIDLVIVLDTSGTMGPLIDSARLKIWEIVNDLAIAEPTPKLRVGLITYGHQMGNETNGWVRVQADLTDDLDLISERLFAARSRGANEYVGRALQTALEQISWSESGHALQFLFLVGNEPPDQDPYVRYQEMSDMARHKGILLSAVFCGQPEAKDAIGWKDMAALADGQFASINHNLATVMVTTGVDQELIELGDLMNETYVAYGGVGKAKRKSRAKEDKNARKRGRAVAATRAITKASRVYSSSGDLVEAYDRGRVNVLGLSRGDLPRSMRGMTDDDRVIFIQEMSDIRNELRERIAELSAERRRIVAERMASRGHDPRAFDYVVRSTIRDRARAAGFYFPED